MIYLIDYLINRDVLTELEKIKKDPKFSEELKLIQDNWDDALSSLSPVQQYIIRKYDTYRYNAEAIAKELHRTTRWVRYEKQKAMNALVEYYNKEVGLEVKVRK